MDKAVENAEEAVDKAKQSIKEIIREFSENTTFHGVRYIGERSEYKSRKFLWILIILSVTTAFMVAIGYRIQRYQSSPSNIELVIEYMDSTPFPAVTICNQNPYKLSTISGYGLYDIMVKAYQKQEMFTFNSSQYDSCPDDYQVNPVVCTLPISVEYLMVHRDVSVASCKHVCSYLVPDKCSGFIFDFKTQICTLTSYTGETQPKSSYTDTEITQAKAECNGRKTFYYRRLRCTDNRPIHCTFEDPDGAITTEDCRFQPAIITEETEKWVQVGGPDKTQYLLAEGHYLKMTSALKTPGLTALLETDFMRTTGQCVSLYIHFQATVRILAVTEELVQENIAYITEPATDGSEWNFIYTQLPDGLHRIIIEGQDRKVDEQYGLTRIDEVVVMNCELIEIPCNKFHCTNGQCIPKVQQCDGYIQCIDGSDERNCPPPSTIECGFEDNLCQYQQIGSHSNLKWEATYDWLAEVDSHNGESVYSLQLIPYGVVQEREMALIASPLVPWPTTQTVTIKMRQLTQPENRIQAMAIGSLGVSNKLLLDYERNAYIRYEDAAGYIRESSLTGGEWLQGSFCLPGGEGVYQGIVIKAVYYVADEFAIDSVTVEEGCNLPNSSASYDEPFSHSEWISQSEHMRLNFKKVPRSSVPVIMDLYTENVIAATSGCYQCQMINKYALPDDYWHSTGSWLKPDNYTIFDSEGTISYADKYISASVVNVIWRFETPGYGVVFDCVNDKDVGVASILIHAYNHTMEFLQSYTFNGTTVHVTGNVIVLELLLYRTREITMTCTYHHIFTPDVEYVNVLKFDGELSENTYAAQLISPLIQADQTRCIRFNYLKQQALFILTRNYTDGSAKILFQDDSKTYNTSWKSVTVPWGGNMTSYLVFHSHKTKYGFVEYPLFVDSVMAVPCAGAELAIPPPIPTPPPVIRATEPLPIPPTTTTTSSNNGGPKRTEVTALYVDEVVVDDYLIANFDHHMSTFFNESAQNLDDLVLRCSWQGVQCNRSYWSETMTDMGKCFSFNADPTNVLHTAYTGLANGLQLTMNVERQEYIEDIGSNAGIKIHMHDQNELALMKSMGYAVSPGTNTLFNLKYLTNEFLEPDYGTCGVTELYLFDKVTYTTSHCLVQCETIRMAAKCNCTLPFMPRYNDVRVCTLFDYINCVIIPRTDTVFIPCDCPDACDQVLYDAELSYSSSSLFTESLLGNRSLEVNQQYAHSLNLQERLRNGSYLDFLLAIQTTLDNVESFDYFRNTDPGYVVNQIILAIELIADKSMEDINNTKGATSFGFNNTVSVTAEELYSEIILYDSMSLIRDQYIANYLSKQNLVETFLDGPYQSSLRFITETIEILRMVELQKGINTALYETMGNLEEALSELYRGVLLAYETQPEEYTLEDKYALSDLNVFKEPTINVKSLMYDYKYVPNEVGVVIGDYIKRYLVLNLKKEKYTTVYQNLILELRSLLDDHVTENSMMENELLKSVANFEYLLEQFQEKIYLDNSFMENNLVQVGIYFEEVKESKTIQNVAYSIGDFFSDLGGFLGLLLGASIVTIFEIIDLIIYKICAERMGKDKNGDDSDGSGSGTGSASIEEKKMEDIFDEKEKMKIQGGFENPAVEVHEGRDIEKA